MAATLKSLMCSLLYYYDVEHRYDVDRFAITLVSSPRHADFMLCPGPAMHSTAQALKRVYDAMPAPKLAFAIGSCACRGGDWFDTHSVFGPVGN